MQEGIPSATRPSFDKELNETVGDTPILSTKHYSLGDTPLLSTHAPPMTCTSNATPLRRRDTPLETRVADFGTINIHFNKDTRVSIIIALFLNNSG